MTQNNNPDPATTPSTDTAKSVSAGQRQVEVAVRRLNADKRDIEQLLGIIHGKTVAVQQIPALLRLAYTRLLQLRAELPALGQAAAANSDLHELIEQARAAVEPGETFSLETAFSALAEISRLCAETGKSVEHAASAISLQGLIAAIRQDFREAVELYSIASKFPGLRPSQQWTLQRQSAIAAADLGREFGEQTALLDAVRQLQGRVTALAPKADRPDDWATTRQTLGDVLGVLGQRQGGTRNLENAITVLRESLSLRDRDATPLEWAETQNSLGNALGILGHRLGDEELLDQSVVAFELALEERTRTRSPEAWASTSNNLAAMLLSLGKRNKDTGMLKRAVNAYKDVLQVWTRDIAPLDWATTMDNLGTALRVQGEYRKGPRTLEQSVAAYHSALAERSRETLPQEWATTQNNLGAALHKLAERTESTETLEKAIDAYEHALKEWTRERMPMAWAMTTANLAVSRRTLAEANRDSGYARMAVEELEAVSEAFKEASHPQYSELSIDQLAKARKLVSALSAR